MQKKEKMRESLSIYRQQRVARKIVNDSSLFGKETTFQKSQNPLEKGTTIRMVTIL